jgi:hypothetical protein
MNPYLLQLAKEQQAQVRCETETEQIVNSAFPRKNTSVRKNYLLTAASMLVTFLLGIFIPRMR